MPWPLDALHGPKRWNPNFERISGGGICEQLQEVTHGECRGLGACLRVVFQSGAHGGLAHDGNYF